MGESLGSRFASAVIVISHTIATCVEKKYGRKDSRLIFNGVRTPEVLPPAKLAAELSPFGLTQGQYILALGRLVPEKGFHDLIAAWSQSPGLPPLVIAGDADHTSNYSQDLKASAAEHGVIMTGFIRGDTLQAVLEGARLFVLPSYHEGLPIALLEAMSHNLDVIVSDIPANKDVGLPEAHYFRTGDIASLRSAIERRLASPPALFQELVQQRYNWDRIADQTLEVYKKASGMR